MEAGSLAAALNEEPEGKGQRFNVKTVSLTTDPIQSIWALRCCRITID
ncbi:hypothetical protein [Planococcus faecalis]|nr:hypothetical protein [Planococcus faecalis]